jgi:hypothetical protein
MRMKAFVKAARIARIVSGVGLLLLTALWSVLLLRVGVGFAVGGADGARGNLHRMILGGAFWGQIDQDPIVAVSRGYERLILCLLITWALGETYRLAAKKSHDVRGNG